VPITNAAAELMGERGFYDENPGTDIAVQQLSLNPPTANSARPAFRQLRADPRHHQRRAGGRLGRSTRRRKRR
jgi:hypothetical protein